MQAKAAQAEKNADEGSYLTVVTISVIIIVKFGQTRFCCSLAD